MEKGYTLIAFTDSWGYTKGGINAFNSDFLIGLKTAYQESLTVVCVVLERELADDTDAKRHDIKLVKAYYKPESQDTAKLVVNKLIESNLHTDKDKTILLGHDRISGHIANLVAVELGARSAVIHHMSYDHYETVVENADSTQEKVRNQRKIFEQADIRFAVGPLLRDALGDLIDSDDIYMLIPGLAEIDPRKNYPKTFSMFVSGRLNGDASKLKQGQLAVAAFADSVKRASKEQHPKNLLNPKLLLRGVSYEKDAADYAQSEVSLKQFAQEYAGKVINIQPLPYTTDREDLLHDLKSASAAAMPSWHEGFGLVAWEAIAAEIPLIVSKHSGVYQLLEEAHSGYEEGFIWPVDIQGQVEAPYFTPNDLDRVQDAITSIARDIDSAKTRAKKLKNEMAEYTWSNCAETAMEAFGWNISKGVVKQVISSVPPSKNDAELQIYTSQQQNQPELTLLKSVWKPGVGSAVSVLLRAGEETVPFDSNREQDLDTLLNWAQQPTFPIAVRLIRGAGGEGKTRLANELAKRLIKLGWHAGFYTSELAAKLSQTSCLNPAKPNLLILDYAETRTDELIALLKHTQSVHYAQSIRILLLARDSGEWWENLATRDAEIESLLLGPATTGPVAIRPLYHEAQQRQSAFQAALAAYAKVLSVSAPHSEPSLDSEHFSKPLYIQMLALLTLHGEQPRTASSITKAILNHEQRYWRAALNNREATANDIHAKKLLALATLAGNFKTVKEALSFWKSAGDSSLTPKEFSDLFDCLTPLYPGYQGLQAIKPDLLGEELVAGAIAADGALLDVVLAAQSSEQIKEHALTILARVAEYRTDVHEVITQALANSFPSIVQVFIRVSQEADSCLPRLAEFALSALATKDQHSVAKQISSMVPYDSLTLNALVCAADKVIYEHIGKKALKPAHKRNPNTQQELAIGAQRYAVSLLRVGSIKQAKLCAKRALDIFEMLVEKSPQRHLGDLSASLSNYANCLSEMGEHKEAKEYAHRALEIDEKLVEESPQRYLGNLSTSLNNYANRLSEMGDYKEAKEYAHRALEILEKLAEESPQRYLRNLSASLSIYANCLSEMGEHKEAKEYAHRALEILEKLAEESPQRYLGALSTSLSYYANCLSKMGEYKEAKEYAHRALEIREKLAEESPQRYLGYLSMSLNNYANRLSEMGDYKEAKEYAHRTLEILEKLAEESPQRYLGNLSASLNNYASCLSEMGEYKEAKEYAHRALEILEKLAEESPQRYLGDLSMSLCNYGSYLSEMGEYNEAKEYAHRALEIREKLAEESPQRYLGNLSTSLSNYAEGLSNVGEHEKAKCYYERALLIQRKLFNDNSKRYAFEFGKNSLSYALTCWLAGNQEIECDFDIADLKSSMMPEQKKQIEFLERWWSCVIVNKGKPADFISLYNQYYLLSKALRLSLESYFYLLCAKLRAVNSLPDSEQWIKEWSQYKHNRKQRVPKWMLQTAKKLTCELPDI